ncbi:hypothetical protein IAU60_004257 [Kwoniella sp. DSM 27419]
MRIASGGSIQAYVDFALGHLRENPRIPLVLHTLPPEPGPSAKGKGKEKAKSNHDSDTTATQARANAFQPCTLAVPRLVTVVEIIKRTYLAEVRTSRNTRVGHGGDDKAADNPGQGAARKGIWQYTESGLHMPRATDEEPELNGLARVLGGKTRPQMLHHPYLQITLSTYPLGLEINRNTTVQYALAKRKPRTKGKGGSKRNTETVDDAQAGAPNPTETMQGDKGAALLSQPNIAVKRKSDTSERAGQKRKKM